MWYLIAILALFVHASSGSYLLQSLDSINTLANTILPGAGLTVEDLLTNSTGVDPYSNVTFWVRNQKLGQTVQVFANDSNIGSKIDLTKPCQLLIHGWTDSISLPWAQSIINRTVVRDDVNIIGVDWSFLASYFYTTAAFKWAPIVADVTSKFIEVLNQNDIPDSQITLVGHSLGCQIAGLVGGLQNGTIATIYALDCAGPGYCTPPIDPKYRLDPTDAQCVKVISTSAGEWGCGGIVYGDESFYPNGGTNVQPACENLPPQLTVDAVTGKLFCSHQMAYYYFFMSLFDDNKAVLTAHRCSNWPKYLTGLCNGNPTDIMGAPSTEQSGLYYLQGPPTVPTFN